MIEPQRIMVAADMANGAEYELLLEKIKGHPVWIKIGMENFYALGSDSILKARDLGFRVFLDLKLHDIPNTVAKSLKILCRLPIEMVNIHAVGGSEMMRAAALTVKESSVRPRLIAVTQLTSTTQLQMNLEQRIPGDLLESVVNFAQLAKTCGCDGVVASPLEASAIKLVCGSSFSTVTPGIRFPEASHEDQKRVMTPLEAIRNGSDYLVIGRPITQHQDPRRALELILKGEVP